jgi:hypothetical protein
MSGITIIRNRANLYAYCTISYRDANKKPNNMRKCFGLVPQGTNQIVFNDYGMATLHSQDIPIESLNHKYLKEISQIIEFRLDLDPNLYRSRCINFNNSIIVKDDLISRFSMNDQKSNDIVNPSKKSKKESDTDKNNFNKPKDINMNTNTSKDDINIANTHQDIIINSKSTLYESLNIFDLYNLNKTDTKIIIKDFEVKTYGTTLLLDHISNSIGLTNILKSVFPTNWKEILSLSFYFAINNESFMYCEDWIESVDSFITTNKLASQRISDLLATIQLSDRYNFYSNWAHYRHEIEYYAFDVTSISSYSTKNVDVVKGYNRDGEKMPQINLCMLFGEESGLPIYSTPYPGSVTDVKSFCTTLDQIDFLNPDKEYRLVFDKGFYSAKNINKLLYNEQKKFLLSIPIKSNYIIKLIDQYRNVFNANNLFTFNNEMYYGKTINYKWDDKHTLFMHIYYNESIYQGAKDDVNATMVMLKEQAELNPLKYKNTHEHRKYLIFTPTKDDPNKYVVSFKVDNITKLYQNKGWMFILSNDVDDYKQSLSIYRHKDIVEKAFNRLKNNLDLMRLRTHTDITSDNKIFLGFLALLLLSVIHKTMTQNNLYSSLTVKKLIKKLGSIKYVYLDNNILIKPITKEQNDILKAFNITFDII